MPAEPGQQLPPAASPRHRIRRWLTERGPRQWWTAALVVTLAVAALFGGLDRVETDVTLFAPGEEFSDGQYTVTVHRARLVPELQTAGFTQAPEKPGRRYLGVVVTLRNDGTVSGRIDRELVLRGVANAEFVGVARLLDGSRAITLGPGLEEELAYVWELPEGQLVPGDSVTVRVSRKSLREGMVIYGEHYIDSDEYGQVVVEVAGPR
ncbi:hypothetical protein CRI77_24015 [Mycolicibacterium duvalii]|uniref:Uncharacterized protein n=1 Tax=Mycolicibacterium duvalii TaxID=39688 RepID=A0A7I7JXI3_9MYCO|nr:hypothetical protein [Mycolicibacterium duvalii]MCV7366941.1 hypothetical protein [Mycolicibacterium duvalii]PEG35983.1 hypothetical protein CRI77_24015 [Mycolicibacterium duvalii]BBX16596.1 hypothetical protein MDUV_14560 [Mycolicibacterium duvalii]